MKTARALIIRNVKLFFKDKGMFLTALITPAILLVLYATFLGDVYRDSFLTGLPAGLPVTEKAVNALVSGQLISSLLAVSCVTVAFCSNFLMVQDKVTGAGKDFRISPVKPTLLSVSYYAATLISTLIICFAATVLCLVYVASTGWYMSLADVLLLLLDVVLLVLFGTALSSVINLFLTSQGQISAVGTVVSSGYGFLCGAYMPIYTFAEGLQRVLSFLPGTYATSLMRTHAMRGALAEIEAQGIPAQAMDGMRDILDCNLYFFESLVSTGAKYLVLCGAILLLIGLYILLNIGKKAEK
jgi:multidrug/hemolysin transport system permease protein